MPYPLFPVESRLSEALQKRSDSGALRKLRRNEHLIDFCSNDYLGFARSAVFAEKLSKKLEAHPGSGSTGSRLLSGNTAYAEELEARIATWHGEQAGLIFNSGYDANIGLFSSLISRGDLVIYDSLIHASIRDGIRLSNGKAFSFRHNDTGHLEERLKHRAETAQVFVAIESVYSMDGDLAPLGEINALCLRYGANLIVDEAHATGVFGKKGEGLVRKEHSVFARIHTFGKALGCHGAIVLGGNLLRDWLINYARSFIYTTALPPASLAAIDVAYELMETDTSDTQALHERVRQFTRLAAENRISGLIPSSSPIQCILVPGNDAVRKKSARLELAGFDVRPILSPTVAAGTERLRICLHSYNSAEDVSGLISSLQD